MRKDAFIYETKAQYNNLYQWLSEIQAAIDKQNQQIAELQQQRQQVLDRIAARLLPDLSDTSLARLNATLPNLITGEWIDQQIANRQRLVQQRLRELESSFNLNTYQSKIAEMDVIIDKLQSDYQSIESGYQSFRYIPGVIDLINRGYGTPAYQLHKWNPQYYTDWKRADEIKTQLNCAEWHDVVSRWENLAGGFEAAKQQLTEAQAQKDSLKKLNDERQSLLDSGETVVADVRNACLLQIKSELDLNVDKSSELLRPVAEIDARIDQCANQINTELQSRRSKVHDQMLALQQIIASASQSNRWDVPDNYASAVLGRQVGPGYPSAPPPQVTQVNIGTEWGYRPRWYYDDWILPYEHTTTIVQYFESQPYGYGGGYQGYQGQGYQNPGYQNPGYQGGYQGGQGGYQGNQGYSGGSDSYSNVSERSHGYVS